MLRRVRFRDRKKKVRLGKKIKNRNNQQRKYYSGKKKRHVMKSQIVVDPKSERIVCTDFTHGRKHDFRLFKESQVRIHPKTQALTDTGYLGIQKIHDNSLHPKKRSKKNPLNVADKASNRQISSDRVFCENVLARLKKFRILSERYRNRRRRFGLRFNLVSGVHNFELIH